MDVLVLLKLIYCLNRYFREAEVFITTTRITVMLICVSAFKVVFFFYRMTIAEQMPCVMKLM